MRAALLLATVLLAAPHALAKAEDEIDVHIEIPSTGPAIVQGAGVTALDRAEGERYAFALDLTAAYTTFEVEAGPGLDLARPRQLVPLLEIPDDDPWCATASVGACEYPLFEPLSNERIWDVDGPARLFFVSGDAQALRLRLGVPGPVKATLVLERDVAPPSFTIRPYTNVTPIGFFQESVTKELALADLQVRAVGETEWIPNPTPVYHFLQRFPVQGLDANTTHEVRILFMDWAGNNVTSPVYTVTTRPEPVRPIPAVTPSSPLPDATVARDGVVVRATFTSPESPVPPDGIRLFFDLTEISEGLGVSEGGVAYAPGTLDPGLHTVSVEVTNEAGGRGMARWTFRVEGANAPGLPLWALLGAAGLLAVLGRRAS